MKNYVVILSRDELEEALYGGIVIKDYDTVGFGDFDGDAVISFCDTDKEPVDLGRTKAEHIVVKADDLDYEEICKRYGNDWSYFTEADDVAKFIIRAAAAGKRIVCQCEYGMSRSAGCAAAIYEFFTGTGINIFADRKLYPSRIIFDKMYKALCCAKVRINDVDVDALRTERVQVDRRKMISKLYSLLKDCPGWDINYNIFTVKAITNDRKFHLYEGSIYDDMKDFFKKYSEEDILYLGVNYDDPANDFGGEYVDSECGIMIGDPYWGEYLEYVKERYGATDKTM